MSTCTQARLRCYFNALPAAPSLKVCLLVVFDPTEMPYICHRHGDPTGTLLPRFCQYDVILLLIHLAFSLTVTATIGILSSIHQPASLRCLPSQSSSSLFPFLETNVSMKAAFKHLLPFCNVNKLLYNSNFFCDMFFLRVCVFCCHTHYAERAPSLPVIEKLDYLV